MIKILNQLIDKIGIDLAILYTVGARMIQGLSGLISVFFVVKYLTQEEQGYFYTFSSIIALQVFFELGLSNIISQFISKASINLEIREHSFEGNYSDVSYLASIFILGKKWFFISAFLLFMFLSIIGYIFFSINNLGNVNWFYPWVFTCFSTSLILILIPYISFISGIDRVEFTSKVNFYQNIIQLVSLIFLFILNFGLFAKPLSLLFGFIMVIFILYQNNYFQLFRNIAKSIGKHRINYFKEIFPYQWKISISWLSGYLIFQLFNPIIFAFDGSISAGKMGMTIIMLTGVQTIAISWITTKIPLFTKLAIDRKFNELDHKFKLVFWQSLILCFLGLILFIIVVYFINIIDFEYTERLLSFQNIILLSLATLANHIMSSYAIYLRSYLKEPLMKMSIIIGILMSLLSLILGKLMGVNGVVYVYFVLMTFGCLPWTYYIYQKCKYSWQKNTFL